MKRYMVRERLGTPDLDYVPPDTGVTMSLKMQVCKQIIIIMKIKKWLPIGLPTVMWFK